MTSALFLYLEFMENTMLNIRLNDGVEIPQIGFGTLNVQPDRSGSEASLATAERVVSLALQAGYRHIDTAQMYGNERGVGRAIAASGIPCQELFITSKLGNGNHKPDAVRRSLEQTLTYIGVERLDLFLMHWPLPTRYDGDYVSTWQAITELRQEELVRSVGVSNFEPDHLDRIITETGVRPSVNQIEVHPQFSNRAACDATERHEVAVEAYSPLGHGAVLGNPTIADVAAALARTPAQVILRWHLQHGRIVIPKSVSQERMVENLTIEDFALTAEHMNAIDGLDNPTSGRVGLDPNTFDWIPDENTTAPPASSR